MGRNFCSYFLICSSESATTPEPTPVPESILGLNGLYDRAQRFLGSTDPQEIVSGLFVGTDVEIQVTENWKNHKSFQGGQPAHLPLRRS